MKQGLLYFLAIFAILAGTGPGSSAYGQNSASASVSAAIIQPIQVSTVRDMDFGIIAAGETSGSVTIAPTAASGRTASGGASLPSGSSTVQSAKFIISGANNCAYTIVLPSETIVLSNGTNTMTVDNFTSTPSGSGVLTPGSQSLYVGATLNVNAHQEPGVYHSTKDFEITVYYY